jgi:hypothetical protein
MHAFFVVLLDLGPADYWFGWCLASGICRLRDFSGRVLLVRSDAVAGGTVPCLAPGQALVDKLSGNYSWGKHSGSGLC